MAALKPAQTALVCAACVGLVTGCESLVGADFDGKFLRRNATPTAGTLDFVAFDGEENVGTLLGADEDEGDKLTYSWVPGETLANVEVQDSGIFIYNKARSPDPPKTVWSEATYEDSFTYRVTDSRGAVAIGRVNVRILPADQTISGMNLSQQKPDMAFPNRDSRLGSSVRIYGNRAIVGAFIGAAYIAEREPSGKWDMTERLKAPAHVEDGYWFGLVADMQEEWALVGSAEMPRHEPPRIGSAFFYRRAKNGRFGDSLPQEVHGDDVAQDFGCSVAIDGTDAVVGAKADGQGAEWLRGAVFVFQLQGDTWVRKQKIVPDDGKAVDYFGTSVAIENGRLAVTAPGHDIVVEKGEPLMDAGAVYLYERGPDGQWEPMNPKSLSLTTQATAPRAALDQVAISQGNLFCGLIGFGRSPTPPPSGVQEPPAAGLAMFFDQNGWGGTPIPPEGEVPKLADRIGFGEGVAPDCDLAVASSFNTFNVGTAYLYYRDRQGPTSYWRYVRHFTTNVDNKSGWGLAIRTDGEKAVIGLGAPQDREGGTGGSVTFYNIRTRYPRTAAR